MGEGFEDLAKIGGRFTMDDITRLRLRAMLERDEGRRTKMYLDSEGVPTIGIGHNLRDRAISDHAVDVIFEDDLRETEQELAASLPWVAHLDEVRYCVLVGMAFNLGVAGLLGFKRMLDAIQSSNWDKAADEMRDSKWAGQVGARATRYERLMLTGSW